MKNTDCIFDSISFSVYTPEEVRKLSIKEIKSFISFEPTLGSGSINGLYDAQLGSINENQPCRNCNLPFFECNGHFGRIEFPKPIYNPVLFGILFKLLRGMCFYCHTLTDSQGLNEVLYSLGLTDMYDDVKRFNDVEELMSLPYDARVEKALACMSVKKDSLCNNCSKKKLILNKSRKAELLVHIAAKITKACKTDTYEPDSKRIKLDEQWDEMNMEKPILNDKYESPYSRQELYNIHEKKETVLMPEIVREHLRYLWTKECRKLKLILPFLKNSNFKYPTDAFFMENMLINPPMNRLPTFVSSSKMAEGPETANMAYVIKACSTLNSIIENRQPEVTDIQFIENLREAILEVQQRVNTCLDANYHRGLRFAQPGLRQRVDKKSGLIRQNIMGKRVNYACRSVISPDPNIGLDEIGLPIIFLKKLTFAENYSPLNQDFLRQCILNGPDEYPGANSYKINNQPIMNIHDKRSILADYIETAANRGKNVTIYRHAMAGDYLIMNRQPTLHKASLQAHKIREVIDPNAKTIRMHYSNCKAYNADFDGDEMNGHFMQTILSQTEAKLLVNVANQHSTPKDGSPLAGLIQDHVIAGTRICMRDTFLERHEYFDLIKNGLRDNYVAPMKILPPAIVKPKRLWTGKQVLSTIIINSIPAGNRLPNIYLNEPKKNDLWQTTAEEARLKLSDVDLVIADGYICTGIFDKVHIGPSQKGLCSDLRELYGNDNALQVLTNLSRCLNRYLIYTGFSVNIKDGFLNDAGEEARNKVSSEMKAVGLASIVQTFGNHAKLSNVVHLMEKAQFDKSDEFKDKAKEIDGTFKRLREKYMNDLDSFCKANLQEKFPHNNLLFMANTGAKGSDSNVKKIAVALGPIEIEGQRAPLTLSGRTLPSFVRYDFDPLSRGFCMSRFTSGLTPQELYFESTAGRDGLVDTAVKTSNSGYLQRCIIKQLEDITVRHDGTVRDNSDNIIQFKYGYDGLDNIKSITISNSSHMEIICRNMDHFAHKLVHNLKSLKIDPNILRKSDLGRIDSLISKMATEQINLSEAQKEMLKKIVSVRLMLSACEPGEPVGLIAAQSVGEPSTQMTLNTFHNAGQSEMNVTLGIPRLREILMTGSETIKTPSMLIPILKNSSDSIDRVIKDLNKLRLKDVIQLPLKMDVNKNYDVTFNLKKFQEFKHLTNLNLTQIITRIETTFFKSLYKTLSHKIYNVDIEIKEDTETKEVAELAEVAEGEEGGDKVEKKVEEEEEEEGVDVDDEDDDNNGDESSDEESSEKVDTDKEDEEMEDDEAAEVKKLANQESINVRIENVKRISKYFVDYQIDSGKKPKWIKLTLELPNARIDLNSILMDLVQRSVIYETKNISKAFVVRSKTGDFLCTEGYNHLEAFKYDHILDLNKFGSNNVVKMSKLYGIEAAVSCLEYEIKSVFKPYNIDIDSRHLRLIAEQLTFSGKTGGYNRHSMKYHSSPIQRSSFEVAWATLNDMLYKAQCDTVKSPSANLLLGQVVSHIGGNAMELLFQHNKHMK